MSACCMLPVARRLWCCVPRLKPAVCAQPYVAPLLLMPVVLLTATAATLLLHVATKWTAYGRGTVAQYRKYSWRFQARALRTCA